MKILAINNPFIDIEYFKSKGLILEVEHITVNKVFPPWFTTNATMSDGSVVPIYTPDVRSYLETIKKGYSGIVFNWDASQYDERFKYTGGYTYHSPLSNGAFWCTTRAGNNQFPQHELMHVIGNIINIRLGDRVPKDYMDATYVNGVLKYYYINDYLSTDPTSNFNVTWELYKPFLKQLNELEKKPFVEVKPILRKGMRNNAVTELQQSLRELGYFTYPINTTFFGAVTDRAVRAFQKANRLVVDGIVGKNTWGTIESLKKKPSVVITRLPTSEYQTEGSLIAYKEGSTFSCKSLELGWKDNKNSISCIPKGEYQVKWTFSPKFRRFMYEVLKVPSRSGIRIHKGNYAFKKNGKPDIEGCILLGTKYQDVNKDGVVDIIESTITVEAFEKFMKKEPFTIIIK